MTDNEKLTPERAVRLLRAKGAELESWVLHNVADEGHVWQLTADIALIAQLLADHIEATTPPVVPLATQQRLGTTVMPITELRMADRRNTDHANEHIIDLSPGRWFIQHPLSERLDGSLLDCQVTWPADDTGVMYGRYVLVWDEEAEEWVLGEKL